MDNNLTKVTFQFAVRIKRANIVFAEGFDPGVIATQEVTFTVPKDYSTDFLAVRLREEALAVIRDVIDVDMIPISVPEPKNE